MQTYLTYNPATGAVSGGGTTPDGTFPPNSIECSAAEYADPTAYAVQNGFIVAATPVLATVQALQAAAISAACAAAITGGFTSSALGEAYTYPSKDTDQQNLASSIIAALLATQSAAAWAADFQYAASAIVNIGGQLIKCVSGGTSGAAAPALPTASGQIVNDGSVQWELWTTPFWCENALGAWAFVAHTSPQIQQVGVDGKQAVLTNMAKNQSLQDQIVAATTVAAVHAITWS